MNIKIELTDSEEDQETLRRYMKSTDLCMVIHDIKHLIQDDRFDNVRDDIYGIIEKYNINIDDLIT